jgi:hypothetical protein
VVKAHPSEYQVTTQWSETYSKKTICPDGGVHKFERAILIIRNPYDAIWAQFQRRITQSHVDGIPRKTFPWQKWINLVPINSHIYYNLFHVQHKYIFDTFDKKDYILIRYEDMRNKTHQKSKLYAIVKFLNLNTTVERIQCAFTLAESKYIYIYI